MLCLSLVMVVVAVSSLNVAPPTLVQELGATASELQWIVDSYALIFAGLLLPAGALGDRFGRRGALQLGMAIFAVGAGLSALSDTANQLIATRALMGIGAAFVMPATLSILTDVFPPAERTRAIAIWAGFAGAGAGIGPIASGLILENWDWPVVFLINIPIALIALGLGFRLIPSSRDPESTPLGPIGAVRGRWPRAVAVRDYRGPVAGLVGQRGVGDRRCRSRAVWRVCLVGAANAYTDARPQVLSRPRIQHGCRNNLRGLLRDVRDVLLADQYVQFSQGHRPLGAGVRTLPMATR